MPETQTERETIQILLSFWIDIYPMTYTAAQFHQSFQYNYNKDSGQQALFKLV